ncbi:MAG: hypothetical protein Pg6A_19820 [Termitinemataceae bacterium]|nr:MAG: hypothetical protein Pg6A_19820 [Termitinemataceae bacterium]
MSIEEDNVYGRTYHSALLSMSNIDNAIDEHYLTGFNSAEEMLSFVEQYNLNIVALSKSQHTFLFINHKGEALVRRTWMDTYAQVLYYYEEITLPNGKKKTVVVKYDPANFSSAKSTRIFAERTDGIRQPLYHRDYFTPRGYYNPVTKTFNNAYPFTVPAKYTGRDTSHIHTLLRHTAGECYFHLLAWLREKMINPTRKTGVAPIFVTQTQGTGKSTFGEVICRGVFGEQNVIVSHQVDVNARFNADQAEALIVCIEEKDSESKRNDTESLKSSVTSTTVRKENKGVDPFYIDSYTDFVMSSNKDVALKLESASNRRFMLMAGDEEFTRHNPLADEVFTKLYGADTLGNVTGVPFYHDNELIAQFKHELYTGDVIKSTNPRNFPVTKAAEKCLNIPRTNEDTEIESLVRTLIPFIKQSLLNKHVVLSVEIPRDDSPEGDVIKLSEVVPVVEGVVYINGRGGRCDRLGMAQPIVFSDNGKPYNHAVLERTLSKMRKLLEENGLEVMPNEEPPNGGFKGINSRYRMSPTIWFKLTDMHKLYEKYKPTDIGALIPTLTAPVRNGKRVRYSLTRRNDEGEFETVNEIIPGKESHRLKENAAHLDTFLLESDVSPKDIHSLELARLREAYKSGMPIAAADLFRESRALQLVEAQRLFDLGIAARVVDSGIRSLHILVRVSPAPNNLEERKWLDGYIKVSVPVSLEFDPVTWDPLRLTRAPVTIDRQATSVKYFRDEPPVAITGTQKLIMENWDNVYQLDWRPEYEKWLSRPKSKIERRNSKLVPTKQEYKDAAEALLYGKFFTDSKFNGLRQHLFFPAYRLLRSMGYSYDELWKSINEDVDGYAQSEKEKYYWRTRQHSKIIRDIETEFSV